MKKNLFYLLLFSAVSLALILAVYLISTEDIPMSAKTPFSWLAVVSAIVVASSGGIGIKPLSVVLIASIGTCVAVILDEQKPYGDLINLNCMLTVVLIIAGVMKSIITHKVIKYPQTTG